MHLHRNGHEQPIKPAVDFGGLNAGETLKGEEAASLVRAVGRYYISTSDRYSLSALLVSLRRLKVPGWEFEDRLWTGLLSTDNDWLGWLEGHPELLRETLGDSEDSQRLEHLIDVLEIAVGRSGRGSYAAPESQVSIANEWAETRKSGCTWAAICSAKASSGNPFSE